MPLSETYRKRLPLLTRTIFNGVMDINELSTSMVDVPSEFVKPDLNQKIWNGTNIKPEVHAKLMEIVTAYEEHLGLQAKPKAIRLLGSMANYNWTEVSDIDIHLFYDLKDIDNNKKLATEYLETKGIEWKEKHKISIKGYNVEMYAQDIHGSFHSGGIYDLIQNKWITEPHKEKITVDRAVLKSKISAVATAIEEIKDIDNQDSSIVYKKAKALKDKIKRMRQSGLEKGGEYSIENLTFKYLRNKGYLEKLSDIVLNAFDAQLSLAENLKLNESINDVSDSSGINRKFLKEKVFKNTRNPYLIITVTMTTDGKIIHIENDSHINFPYKVGQFLNRNHETWACNNNYTVNDVDMCPEEKIFGIRTKDIPQGHELRMLYPGKFKNENTTQTMNESVNPWAICHSSVGPKKNDKFEGCVQAVKKENNIDESDATSVKHKLILKKSVDNFDDTKIELTKQFIIDCCKELGITKPCVVYLTGVRGGPITTTASYNPGNDEIWIYTKNRNVLVDILRSIAHEIRHFKQKLDGVLNDNSGITGSNEENEANSFAGIMIRNFGKNHRIIYERKIVNNSLQII